MRPCGDISFCDSTLHLTKYVYKLSSVTVFDSEGSTSTVHLNLRLHETADKFKRILVSWHEAFRCCHPHMIMTDEDEDIFAAIALISNS